MTESKGPLFVLKRFLRALMCVCLLCEVCLRPIICTAALDASRSVTCVNSFVGEGQPESPPDSAQEQPAMATGDEEPIEWYAAGILFGMAGVAAVWKIYRRKNPYK